MNMHVEKTLTTNVYSVGEDAPLLDVYRYMEDQRIRHVAVVNGKKLVGIVSDRDILLRAELKLGKIEIPPAMKISDVMRREVLTCTKDARLGDVADIFIEKKIDCLPVLGVDGHLVGMITTTDLLVEIRRREGVSDTSADKFGFQIQPIV